MSKFFSFRAKGTEAAELFIYADIGSWEDWGDISAESFQKELSQHAGKKIFLRVNSFGGEVHHALAIYSMLRRHDGEIVCTIDGVAASAATLIAMAADKIFAYPSALWLVHNASGYSYGGAEKLEKSAGELRMINAQMAEMYAKKTGATAEEMLDLMAEDRTMSAREAFELGFLDGILEDGDVEIVARAGVVYAGGIELPARFAAMAAAKLRKEKPAPLPRAQALPKEAPMKTLEDLKAAHPALYAELEAKVSASAIEEERARMRSIDEIAHMLDDELVAKAKYETGATAEALAYAAARAAAAKGDRWMAARKEEVAPVKAIALEDAPVGIDAEQARAQDEDAVARARAYYQQVKGVQK